jgi:SAM-dependent methyltransferase
MGDTADSEYQLGSDAAELDRLDHQGRVLAPATRTILEAAGLGPGIRVLHLGSGMGDVAFVAAELIGPSGEVMGIDRSPEAVAKANIRAQQRDHGNVRFVVGDINDTAPAGPFDAIIGRLVLMYLPDPAALLKTQAALLRPGGRVVPDRVRYLQRSLPATNPARGPGVVVACRGVHTRRSPNVARATPLDRSQRCRAETSWDARPPASLRA